MDDIVFYTLAHNRTTGESQMSVTDTADKLRRARYARKSKKNEWGGFVLLDQAETQKLVLEKDLTLTDLRVLLWAIGSARYHNYVTINQTEMAEAAKMPRPRINKALQKLVELSYLHKGKKHANGTEYRISPFIMYRGTTDDWHVALTEICEMRFKVAEEEHRTEKSTRERAESLNTGPDQGSGNGVSS